MAGSRRSVAGVVDPIFVEFMYALHMAVKEHELGISGVARVLDVNESTLITMLNPKDLVHIPNIWLVSRIMTLIQNTLPLDVYCQIHEGQFATCTREKAESVMEALLRSNAEHADVGKRLLEYLRDGVLDDVERAKLRKEALESKRELDVFINTLDSLEGGL